MPESTIPAIGNAPASLMTDLGSSKRTGGQGNRAKGIAPAVSPPGCPSRFRQRVSWLYPVDGIPLASESRSGRKQKSRKRWVDAFRLKARKTICMSKEIAAVILREAVYRTGV